MLSTCISLSSHPIQAVDDIYYATLLGAYLSVRQLCIYPLAMFMGSNLMGYRLQCLWVPYELLGGLSQIKCFA